MFVTAEKMRAIEESLFGSGVEAEPLMNLAGLGIAREIRRRFPTPATAIAVIGTGNNGADALVALAHLREAGWQIAVRSARPPESLEKLPLKKWEALGEIELLESLSGQRGCGQMILLDGLLGIGSRGELREPVAGLAREMNVLRASGKAITVAIDLPSGLDCDSGKCGKDAVVADVTITLGSPKAGLIADDAASSVGSLSLIPLPGLSEWPADADHLIVPETLAVEKLIRPFDFHKGLAGRVGIVAGSRGFAGAAALTSLGALRGGAGLITLFVREEDYPLILPLVPIEVMVKPLRSYLEILDQRLDALAIGPGLGDTSDEVLSLISKFKNPTVLDADALNLIARSGGISELGSHQIVTPHPGEMARLLPDFEGSRAEIAREFTRLSTATLLFKGARTIVTSADSPLAYNTTGTPAMATGGEGDVLTGVIAAFLARGLATLEAAKMGAWLTGRASEIALPDESMESLSATTTTAFLGKAFQSLRRSR